MKTRPGYASSCNANSFCILGITLYNVCGYIDVEDCDILITHESLDNYSEDTIIIGAPITSMRDDETLAEFKARIIKEIHSVGFKDVTIEDLEWYIDCGHCA